MLKYSSIVLLIAVATFWSQVDARSQARKALSVPAQSILSKRDANDDYSTGSQEELAKSLLAGLLLLKTETSAEMETLSQKYQAAFSRNDWDSLDEFARYLADTYQEVTGRKIDDSDESDEP